ncbi:MAG: DUF2752 domain-containing protein [Victivallales bacterium]|nr:DUF2752 domain-containing protein [Victivallales bacterium]
MTNEHNQSKHAASRQSCWREAARLFSALLFVAAIILLAYSLGIVLCPLKRFTGIPCPTCGSTRAVLRALHGDFRGAFMLQPLVMTLAVASIPVALVAVLSKRVKHILKVAFHHPLTWFLAALAIAANWVYVIMNGN